MTQDSSGTPVPAAFNGSQSAARQTADGVAAIAGMLPQLAQSLGGLLAQLPQAVGQAVQVPQHLCAQCVVARMTWGAANQAEVKAAIGRAAQAAGIPEGDPRAAQLDPAPFLAEQARRSMPPLQPAITTVQGTDVCGSHVPGRPGGQQLLIASGSLSSAMLAGIR
jgi:hypothetical protein